MKTYFVIETVDGEQYECTINDLGNLRLQQLIEALLIENQAESFEASEKIVMDRSDDLRKQVMSEFQDESKVAAFIRNQPWFNIQGCARLIRVAPVMVPDLETVKIDGRDAMTKSAPAPEGMLPGDIPMGLYLSQIAESGNMLSAQVIQDAAGQTMGAILLVKASAEHTVAFIGACQKLEEMFKRPPKRPYPH